MEVNGQIYVLIPSALVKYHPAAIKRRLGWPQIRSVRYGEKSLAPAGNRIPGVQPLVLGYTV
jgi:hypothetical protein